MRLKKTWERTAVRGHTKWWQTWPLWNKEKLLLSWIVQKNASQKNERWTQRMTTPSFAKKEAAIQSPKKGKSARVDITAELVQAGGEDVVTALTTICNKVWQTGEWPTPWTQSLVITLPKKGNLQQCQNDRMISLISHAEDHTVWTDRSRKQRRSLLKNRQASEQEEAPQSRWVGM